MVNKNIEEDFRVLKIITSSLLETIEDLKTLEIEGKKDTLEYEGKIKALKSTKSLEMSIYERIPNDIQIIEELESKLNIKTYDDASIMMQEEINELLSKDKDILIRRRIYNGLRNKLSQNIDLKNVTIMDFLENKDLSIISNTTKKDMYNTLLAILDTYLKNSEYQSITIDLINIKYHLAFLWEDILKELIDSYFNIDSHPYLESEAISDLYGVSKDMLNVIKIILVKEILTNNIIYALRRSKASINDIDYVISEAIIRMSFLFLNEEREEEFKKSIMKLISDSGLTIDNILARRKMERIIGLLESDKLIPIKISLKK